MPAVHSRLKLSKNRIVFGTIDLLDMRINRPIIRLPLCLVSVADCSH